MMLVGIPLKISTMSAAWQPQFGWIMVQGPVTSFLSVKIATTGSLEATPGVSQVHSLLSVNIVTPGIRQVVHRFTPDMNHALVVLFVFCITWWPSYVCQGVIPSRE